jgi:hypothetical protein
VSGRSCASRPRGARDPPADARPVAIIDDVLAAPLADAGHLRRLHRARFRRGGLASRSGARVAGSPVRRGPTTPRCLRAGPVATVGDCTIRDAAGSVEARGRLAFRAMHRGRRPAGGCTSLRMAESSPHRTAWHTYARVKRRSAATSRLSGARVRRRWRRPALLAPGQGSVRVWAITSRAPSPRTWRPP